MDRLSHQASIYRPLEATVLIANLFPFLPHRRQVRTYINRSLSCSFIFLLQYSSSYAFSVPCSPFGCWSRWHFGGADGGPGHQRGVRGRDRGAVVEAAKGGRAAGRGDAAGGLLPAVPDEVRAQLSPAVCRALIVGVEKCVAGLDIVERAC